MLPAKTKLLVFDFDGVIVDSSRVKHELYLTMVSEKAPALKARLDEALTTKLVGAERLRIAEWIRDNLLLGIDAKQFVADFTARLALVWETVPTVPGACQFLDKFLNDPAVACAIASAAPSQEIVSTLGRLGIATNLFYKICGIDSGPKSIIIQGIQEELGLPGDKTIFFGDMPSDLKAGRETGSDFVRVESWGGQLCSWENFQNVSIANFYDPKLAACLK